MSSKLLKLNVESLSREDICEILSLSPNFTESDFNKQVNKYKITMKENSGISEEIRMKITDLFISAKKKLFVRNKQIKNTNDVQEFDGHMLINPEQKNYTDTYNNEYPTGTVNPLRKTVITTLLNIDTRFRSNYYSTPSTDFIIDIPTQFNKVVSMKLTSIELPTSFYNISAKQLNNYFMIESKETNNQLMIIIPDGNYDYLALSNYINNYLGLQNVFPWNNIKCFIDINHVDSVVGCGSGKMIFGLVDETIQTSFELNFKTNINGIIDKGIPLNIKIGWMMGYREGFYEGGVTYISESLVDLTGIRYLFLMVEDYNNNYNDNFVSAFNSSILKKNIIGRIALTSRNFSIQTSVFTTDAIVRQYFGGVNIQRLRIQLLDEYGRIVDLHGLDYSFCLSLDMLY
jgi:hypothetical protein